jgi:uncharacterized membrane protein
VAVAILAIMPVAELRGSIPYGISVAKLQPVPVVLVSILFTWLGGILAFLSLRYLLKLVRQHKGGEQWWQRHTEHLRARHEKQWRRWGAGTILFLTALPIPILGGVYTATLAAYLLGMRLRHFAWVSLFGVVVAATLVTAAVITGSEAMRWMLKH